MTLSKSSKICILGGGSWATALMKMLLDNDTNATVHWFMRNTEAIEYIQNKGRNPKYLSSIKLDTSRLVLYNNINEAVENSDVLIFAIPSAFLNNALQSLTVPLKDKIIFSAIKGIVPEHNLIIGEFFHQQYQVPIESIGVITGPCHAEEVAMERLSYITVAAIDLIKAEFMATRIETMYIKTMISDDIYGTEYSSVLKNIFAVAAGVCHGLNYGDNFQAVLISNAILEIQRFVNTVHPIKRDIKSSAYLGDLLVTAYSKFSRNRTFGTMIGKGYSVQSAQLEMNMVAEGYYATKCIHQINKKYNINMPISDAIYQILYHGKPAAFEIRLLTDKLR